MRFEAELFKNKFTSQLTGINHCKKWAFYNY
jgi:hypothetical protein